MIPGGHQFQTLSTELEAPFSLLGQHKFASGFFDQSPADKADERFGRKSVSRASDLHLLQRPDICVRQLLIRKSNGARTPQIRSSRNCPFRERLVRHLLGLPLLRAVSETGKPIDKLRRLDLFRQVRVIPADASTISAFWARNTESSWVRRSVISGDPRCIRVAGGWGPMTCLVCFTTALAS